MAYKITPFDEVVYLDEPAAPAQKPAPSIQPQPKVARKITPLDEVVYLDEPTSQAERQIPAPVQQRPSMWDRIAGLAGDNPNPAAGMGMTQDQVPEQPVIGPVDAIAVPALNAFEAMQEGYRRANAIEFHDRGMVPPTPEGVNAILGTSGLSQGAEQAMRQPVPEGHWALAEGARLGSARRALSSRQAVIGPKRNGRGRAKRMNTPTPAAPSATVSA